MNTNFYATVTPTEQTDIDSAHERLDSIDLATATIEGLDTNTQDRSPWAKNFCK